MHIHGAAAIFVHARADIERRRRQLRDGAIGGAANQRASPAFARSRFEPKEIGAIRGRGGQPDRAADDELDRHR